MKKIIWFMFLIPCIVLILVNCSGMNDKQDIYMSAGEDIYIGKIDSLKVFTGDERVLLRFWASDPRAKTAAIFWYPYNDSTFLELNRVSRKDSFEIIIGGAKSSKPLKEGSYTFKIITRDNTNHHSIPFEKAIKVYGERYRSTLTNRSLKQTSYNKVDSSLVLTFLGATNEDEIGIELNYFDAHGGNYANFFRNSDITNPLKIQKVDITRGVSYRTLFLPEPMAIDTFYTIKQIIM